MSNHTVRETVIGRLLDADVPELYVVQHCGMDKVESLGANKHTNKENHIKSSDIQYSTKRTSVKLTVWVIFDKYLKALT